MKTLVQIIANLDSGSRIVSQGKRLNVSTAFLTALSPRYLLALFASIACRASSEFLLDELVYYFAIKNPIL